MYRLLILIFMYMAASNSFCSEGSVDLRNSAEDFMHDLQQSCGHKPINPKFKCGIDGCREGFMRLSDLVSHKYSHMKVCYVCNLGFYGEDQFTYHLDAKHPGISRD